MQLKKNILLLVGRDDWQKDELLNLVLLNRFNKSQLKIVWEDPAAEIIHLVRKFERKLPGLLTSTKIINLRITQLLYGLRHPSYFSYLYHRKKNNSISTRCENLKNVIRKLGNEERTIILARSSGARVSSLIADELKIKHLVCLGYPFKHPAMNDEPERYTHLAKINTPMLIIQGVRDEYGGFDIKQKYAFSQKVEVVFIDTNHNFDINEQDVCHIVKQIEDIAGLNSNK